MSAEPFQASVHRVSQSLENRLLINDGSGRFTDETVDRLPQHPDSTVDGDFVDVDDDGDLDLVTGNTDGLGRDAPFRVLVNDGAGRFRDDTPAFFPDSARGRCFDVEAADFDGDGRLDFFFSNRGDRDRLLLRARPWLAFVSGRPPARPPARPPGRSRDNMSHVKGHRKSR